MKTGKKLSKIINVCKVYIIPYIHKKFVYNTTRSFTIIEEKNMRTKLLKNNQKGFTLLELVVVIAILGLLVSVAALSVSSVYGNRAAEAASTFEAILNQTKISTASGRGDNINIRIENGEIRLRQGNDTYDTIKLEDEIDVTYLYGNNESMQDAPFNSLTFSFDRDTGAIVDVLVNETTKVDNFLGVRFEIFGNIKTVRITPSTGFVEII